MHDGFEQARDFFLRGVAAYEAGRFADAERQFAASLALVPGRVSTLTNLGAARLKLGRVDEAIALLDEAIAQEPDNIEALSHRATARAERGLHAQALADFDRSLALQPAQGTAWMHRGSVLRDLGRHEEAVASFEKALAHGADRAMIEYNLAALRGTNTPAAPPREYVRALFDGYAAGFDEHLQQALRYDAPRVLEARIAGRRFQDALDLGCGTGLCGRAFASACDAVDGVDLSAAMLQKARATGVYRDLAQGDAVDFLQATPRRYDLVIAADMLIYVGAPEGLFAGVRRVLRPGGVFCFTVESSDDDGPAFVLRPSLRYAHSRRAIERLAASSGFRVDAVESRPIRAEQSGAIPGCFFWLSA